MALHDPIMLISPPPPSPPVPLTTYPTIPKVVGSGLGMLVAINFDNVICEDNTDVLVVDSFMETIPNGKHYEQNVREVRSTDILAYMNKIFEFLHDNSVNASQIEEIIVGIPAVEGMTELLTTLHGNGHEIIIISDTSNSVFIDCWLRSKQLKHVVSRVFTNPARYDDDGRLRVDPYHIQRTCDMSVVNLCKGQVLVNYIQDRHNEGKSYERIVFIGNEWEDLCPIMRLSEADLACSRNNFFLQDRLNLPSTIESGLLKAKIVQWENGTDLRHKLGLIIDLCYISSR